METFRRPNPLLLATEAPRAASEMSVFAASLPLLGRAPKGDGHPVLVLPGFTADDTSTRPLRWFLRRLGYTVHGWRLGLNVGPTDRIIDGLGTRFIDLADRHGRAISIVGWSLGGIYAREMAREAPDAVRQVITLGSPFRLHDREASNAGALYEALSTFHSTRVDEERPAEDERPPLPVPATAIYTRADGIAPWRSCRDLPGARRESIEVLGSHCGLGHNPAVLWIVADRLAQPEGQWSPYRRPWARSRAA